MESQEKKIDIKEEFLKLPLKIKIKNITICSQKDNKLKKEEIGEIINTGEFNISDYEIYINFLKKISAFVKINFDKKQKRNFLPKIKIGDKFIPIFGKDFQEKEKRFIENNNEIQVIAFCGSEDYGIFKGTSRISTAMKILRNTFNDDNELNKIQYSNIFMLEYKDDENTIKEKLDNLELFEIKNLKNYFITEEDLLNSKEYFGYDIDLYSEFYLIVDENGIIKHLGKFDESDRSLEKKIKKLIKYKKEKEEKEENNNNNNNNNKEEESNCFKVKNEFKKEISLGKNLTKII